MAQKTGVIVVCGRSSEDQLIEVDVRNLQLCRAVGCLPSKPQMVLSGKGKRHSAMKGALNLEGLTAHNFSEACFGRVDPCWTVSYADWTDIRDWFHKADNHLVVVTDIVVVEGLTGRTCWPGVYPVVINGGALHVQRAIFENGQVYGLYAYDD